MNGFKALQHTVSEYLTEDKVATVRAAYDFAEYAHRGQMRKSGEPYITHPVAAAHILAQLKMDHEMIAATIMHDVIEDCDVSKEEMQEQFGTAITELVDGVTKITNLAFTSKAKQQAETIRKTLMAMAQDIRVILIKLADRTHNMQTLGAMKPESRRKKARETLDIYAPIAHRLGMYAIGNTLEDLSFAALYPWRAKILKKCIATMYGEKEELINTIKVRIQQELKYENIDAVVLSRQKHIWSIYRKMQEDSKHFDEILDIIGFRIITKDIKSCYIALGILHNHYRPIPGRFKDYIALPRANGYQSLHSTLHVERGLPMEIQIRTEQMEELANHGIAAHCTYKNDSISSSQQHRANEWMHNVLELQQRTLDSEEFIEHFKEDLFPTEVNVLTPKGDIIVLPKGATPVDFAYAVHTDVGNTCISCLVNNVAAPLNKKLRSGQTIKITTSPLGRPHVGWLDFAVSSKARSSIRQYMKSQKQSDAIKTGQLLLEEALVPHGLSMEMLDDITIENRFPDIAGGLQQICEEIGGGLRQPILTAYQLSNVAYFGSEKHKIPIKGTENMITHYARCCFPIPGDAIAGHISTEKGLVIHRSDCRHVTAKIASNSSHWLHLSWDMNKDMEFTAGLKITLHNQRGALAQLTSILSRANINISHIETLSSANFGLSTIFLEISVHDTEHLNKAIRTLSQMKEVAKIKRQ